MRSATEIKELLSKTHSRNRGNIIKSYDLTNDIITSTAFLEYKYEVISLSQRIWHILNDKCEIVYCTICQNKPANFGKIEHRDKGKLLKTEFGYRPCSKECSKQYLISRWKESYNNGGKEKFNNTCLERYNVSHPSKTKEVKEKASAKLKKNYVERGEEIKAKAAKTFMKNYGETHPSRSEKIKEKGKKTMFERHGVAGTSSIPYIKEAKKKKLIDKYEDIFGHEYTIESFNNKFDIIIKHTKCGNIASYTYDAIKYRQLKNDFVLCYNCSPKNDTTSQAQMEIYNHIKSIYDGKIILNDKNIIKPKELDIFIPKLKFAIEYNGLYQHSALKKEMNYHLNKSTGCKDNGIHLMHIWEDDWRYKKEIIKSIISGFMGINTKIYARECQIKELGTDVAKNFIEDNHIQGYAPASIYIGLYRKDELTALMSFTYTNTHTELSRLCFKKYTSIIGGASKMFKYFIRNLWNGKEIITFCDFSMFPGTIYEKLGMTYLYTTEPAYYYFNLNDKIRKHRRLFQKQLLIKTEADKSKTGDELAMERGYYKIYNSGNHKYIYMKKPG